MKRTEVINSNVWECLTQKYHLGKVVRRPIKKIVPNLGLFIALEDDFDALVHITNLKGASISNFLVGQQIEVAVIDIDNQRQRIQLAVQMHLEGYASYNEGLDDWIAANPIESAAAAKWLSDTLGRAPLHAALLSELTKNWKVPKPLGLFARRNGFLVFPPCNVHCAHPAVADPRYVGDPSYWGRLILRLPNSSIIDGSSVVGRDIETDSRLLDVNAHSKTTALNDHSTTKTLLIDGSNIIRLLGSLALKIMTDSFQSAGYRWVVMFDANIRYVLRNTNDKVGEAFLTSTQSENSEHIVIVPSGMRSDDFLLLLADRRGYDIVSCDRYGDEEFAKYDWVKARVESGEKRIHAPAIVLGDLVIPTLDLVVPMNS